ncbi:transcriptional regulator domain-containing protein [Labrys sp. WJW]|uniref:transcriptional regulator domain-containing protein n=1 Tax=Labrys sp. WJW TaxID=1737983 RepID=UPI000AC17D5E|nr:DUF6499 domain-containing protein [Labrys sp. WJW]
MADASQWRSSAPYRHVDNLSASDLAWEWLRRNEAYGRDYAASIGPDANHDAQAMRIRQQWGLQFPGRSFARRACT